MHCGTGWRARRSRALLAGLVLGLYFGLFFGTAIPASAASVPWAAPSLGPGASERISAGRVEVVSLDPAAPGVEERELVLSLDGGRTYPLRLTGEIGPGDREAWWRVPALPSEHAVLALREGGDGAGEEIVAVSVEFTILPGPGLAAEELRFRDGEWKTREADAGGGSLPAPSLSGAAPVRCEPLNACSDAFEEPARALPAAPDRHAVHCCGPAVTGVPGAPPPVSFSPLFLPLRE